MSSRDAASHLAHAKAQEADAAVKTIDLLEQWISWAEILPGRDTQRLRSALESLKVERRRTTADTSGSHPVVIPADKRIVQIGDVG